MRTRFRRFGALLSTLGIALSMLGGTHVRCDDSAMGPGAATMRAHDAASTHAGITHAGITHADGERTAGVVCHDDASSSAPDATGGCAVLAHCVSAALVTTDLRTVTAPSVSRQPAGANDARPHHLSTPPESPPPRA